MANTEEQGFMHFNTSPLFSQRERKKYPSNFLMLSTPTQLMNSRAVARERRIWRNKGEAIKKEKGRGGVKPEIMASFDAYTASEAKKWAEREIMCNNLWESQVGVLFGSCCEGRLSGRGHGKLTESKWEICKHPATLPIYYSSFLHCRQNQFQLKPTLAKMPPLPPPSWGEWRMEIVDDSLGLSC